MMNDLLSADALALPRTFGDPGLVRAIYARLRREEPLARAEPPGFRPFWVLTRHADIQAVERDPETYAAGTRTVLIPEKVEAIYREKYGDPNGPKPLTHMDGLHHHQHRAVTLEWFSRKNLGAFEALIAGIAKEFVDRMEDMGGSCDFAADIAYWYPLRVVMTLLGVPKEDEPQVLKMTQRLFSPADKQLGRRPEVPADGQGGGQGGQAREVRTHDVLDDFRTYFDVLTQDRRANPRNDIATTLANGQVGGCPMAGHERLSYYVLVSTAGHDTTAASIGGGMHGLLEFPDEMAKLRADPGLLGTAAEEFVRWTAPVKHFMRTPRKPVEWHGTTIPAGEAIMLAFASACRDEAVFEEPDRLRVDRSPNPHLAFGIGPHFCLGKYLAKMEIEAFYRELLPRLKQIEPAGSPTFVESTFVSGLKSLPVQYRF